MPPNTRLPKNSPHPATMTLRGAPHPATVAQTKIAVRLPGSRVQHAAKLALLERNSRPPHAATIQRAAPVVVEPQFSTTKAPTGAADVKLHKKVVEMLMQDLGHETPEGFVETSSLQSFGLNYTPNVLDYHISFQYNSSGWCEKLHYAVRDIQPAARKNDVLYWWYQLMRTSTGGLAIGFTGTAGDGNLTTIKAAGVTAGCPANQWTDINDNILSQLAIYMDTYRSVELVNDKTYGWQLGKRAKK